jgi:Protein of unknown function (DUF2917)
MMRPANRKEVTHGEPTSTSRIMNSASWNEFRGDQFARETFELTGAQFVRLTDARGVCVSVRAGTVWITQDGDRNDNVVRAGESLVVDRPGLALVTPIPEATIVISALPALARTCRIQRVHPDGERYPVLSARPQPVLPGGRSPSPAV